MEIRFVTPKRQDVLVYIQKLLSRFFLPSQLSGAYHSKFEQNITCVLSWTMMINIFWIFRDYYYLTFPFDNFEISRRSVLQHRSGMNDDRNWNRKKVILNIFPEKSKETKKKKKERERESRISTTLITTRLVATNVLMSRRQSTQKKKTTHKKLQTRQRRTQTINFHWHKDCLQHKDWIFLRFITRTMILSIILNYCDH